MKAKLINIDMVVRVIVEDNETEDKIIEKALQKASERISTDGRENVVSITDDNECPFDPEFDII